MNFKALRKRQNLSIRQAAEKLGINYQSVCRYENKGRVPTNKILSKMLFVYKCSEQELGEAVICNVKNRRDIDESKDNGSN
ncbi:helix-turn-helix domain-containing protein [Clostridium rectalis]|uniref:helix-turn-helix domain-containing protein n=1 Tax=Clostridium rectalis TaxID=2040295 RepID=UPI000F6365E5|nr:helix-turn-helix transcriptional regulator [Clostridium rectalis]